MGLGWRLAWLGGTWCFGGWEDGARGGWVMQMPLRSSLRGDCLLVKSFAQRGVSMLLGACIPLIPCDSFVGRHTVRKGDQQGWAMLVAVNNL